MDKVKSTIKDFTSRGGHKTVAPAVQHEVYKQHETEDINKAVDKEVHQDHYHRTIQPIHDREVLPERHEARIAAVEEREFDHRDHQAIKENLVTDQAQFRDERVVEATTRTQTVAPTVGAEHVHHHVHETIQPVVEKETIQENVIHNVIPIHEVHHNAAKIHTTSELPPVSMSEFKSKGGVLGGREERYDGFEGEPKNIGGAKHVMGQTTMKKTSSHHGDFDRVDEAKAFGTTPLTTGERTTATTTGTGLGRRDS
ncbi:hypothetical protein M011DRAFT_479032 [Sporormia fimetaria CBS 119925]|uniref:Allergen n=1 Tax=Sporormia fimetaria CBS 119925 TaxID=1340428 RepID=A0A6A6V4V6_9PLEO|nr:hypothetical protein M011DRAFT_479032 [Sporormia fimetaria CBS 119925]